MELLPQVAAELVNSGIPIIVAVGSFTALAAWGATRSVPIVTLTGDPSVTAWPEFRPAGWQRRLVHPARKGPALPPSGGYMVTT